MTTQYDNNDFGGPHPTIYSFSTSVQSIVDQVSVDIHLESSMVISKLNLSIHILYYDH